jgi:hypothetical protein
MKKAALSIGLSLSLIIFLGACSVSQKTLDDAQKRIDALKAKGVPDSSLSTALVYFFQAKDSKSRGNNGLSRLSSDSMRILIAQAEATYQEMVTKKKPEMDDLILQLTRAKSQLSGLQAKKVDSALKVIDSFNQKNWIYQVEANAKAAVNELLPTLKFNEDRAKELRSRVPGDWVCTQVTKNSENKDIHAVEKKIFSFANDGKCKLVETKQGQVSPVQKMDYEFDSYGTWDLLGDTIFMFVNRFVSAKQSFDSLDATIYKDSKGKKKVWRNRKEKPYDSLITDGSQDRWIPFSEMKSDFEKKR